MTSTYGKIDERPLHSRRSWGGHAYSWASCLWNGVVPRTSSINDGRDPASAYFSNGDAPAGLIGTLCYSVHPRSDINYEDNDYKKKLEFGWMHREQNLWCQYIIIEVWRRTLRERRLKPLQPGYNDRRCYEREYATTNNRTLYRILHRRKNYLQRIGIFTAKS